MKPILKRKFSFAPGFGTNQSSSKFAPISKAKSLNPYDEEDAELAEDFEQELSDILKEAEERRRRERKNREVSENKPLKIVL